MDSGQRKVDLPGIDMRTGQGFVDTKGRRELAPIWDAPDFVRCRPRLAGVQGYLRGASLATLAEDQALGGGAYFLSWKPADR